MKEVKPGRRDPRDHQAIDAAVADLLATVGIPQPWDCDEFARRLTRRFGKPVRIRPMSDEVELRAQLDSGITGTIVESPHSISIFYADSGSAMHQQNVIFHEVGHKLFDDVVEGQRMCRIAFAESKECDAERFARTVLRRIRGADSLQLAPHTDDPDGVQSLGGALADIE